MSLPLFLNTQHLSSLSNNSSITTHLTAVSLTRRYRNRHRIQSKQHVQYHGTVMRPSAFTKEQDLALLRLVKENPVLYNNKHADYGNGEAKVQAWKVISEALGKPPRNCKARWLSIRDMMRRIVTKRLKEPNFTRKYRYEQELSFMFPYFRLYSKEFPEQKDGDSEKIDDELSDTAVSEQSIAFAAVSKDEFSVEEPKNSETSNLYQELLGADPLDVFLMSVGSTMRQFSPYYLNQAKSKIFKIVQEYELKQIKKRVKKEMSSSGGEGSDDGY